MEQTAPAPGVAPQAPPPTAIGAATPGNEAALSADPVSLTTVSGLITGMVSVVTLIPGLILTLNSSGASAGVPAALGAIGLFLVALSLLGAAAGFGLLRRLAWSWPAAVVLCTLQALVGLLRFALHEPVAGPILAVLMSGFALAYLFRLQVRAVYGRD
jgi:hypothetical protein